MRVNSLEPIVKAILIHNTEARDSDNILYSFILKDYGNKTGIDFSKVSILNAYSKDLKCGDNVIPSIESVGRCRRKLQETFPELRGSKKKQEIRANEEEEYREYARG